MMVRHVVLHATPLGPDSWEFVCNPTYMIWMLPQQPCTETDLRTSSDESKRPDSSPLGLRTILSRPAICNWRQRRTLPLSWGARTKHPFAISALPSTFTDFTRRHFLLDMMTSTPMPNPFLSHPDNANLPTVNKPATLIATTVTFLVCLYHLGMDKALTQTSDTIGHRHQSATMGSNQGFIVGMGRCLRVSRRCC